MSFSTAPVRAYREHNAHPKISASMLGLKSKSEREITQQCLIAAGAGVDLIHLDVVGGKGRRTEVIEEGSADTSAIFTPALLARLKAAAGEVGSVIVTDVHILDMQPTAATLEKWLQAGADYVTLHWEAYRSKDELNRMLRYIVDGGGRAGLALRPDTDVAKIIGFIENYPSSVQLVSQAGVLPCLGGQTLDFRILGNLRALMGFKRESRYDFEIMVDGGIEETTGPRCHMAGADILVAGTAIFGQGRRDQITIRSALQNLKLASLPIETDVYDVIADRVVELWSSQDGKLWICIEGYHGSGKTFAAERIRERLIERGVTPILVGLDLSWTDRRKRANWWKEAEELRSQGFDHNYYHPLRSEPEPMHWRKAHSDSALAALEKCHSGCVELDDCYQFSGGYAAGKVSFMITPHSVVIVEGVYASELNRQDWDLRIYIETDHEDAKRAAMLRDEQKVKRPACDTNRLYDEVYEPTYNEYLVKNNPRARADIVVSQKGVLDETHSVKPSIVYAALPIHLSKCSNGECSAEGRVTGAQSCSYCGREVHNEIVGASDFLTLVDESYPNMWRYRRLLPVRQENIVTDQEGLTPVVFLEETSTVLGVNLWVKMETENPTGTFKDREASYVMSCSKQFGRTNLVMQSTGNTAMAIAHYAGVAGIASWSFIPSRSLYKLLMPPRSPYGRIIAVDGHPIDVKAVAENFATCFGYSKISPFSERCECNKTMGYEVAEGLLKGSLPEQRRLRSGSFDFYVQTLSAGMGLIGFHAAMEDVQKWTGGKIQVPRIVAIEISEFAPIQTAWKEGFEEVGEAGARPRFPDHPLFEPTLWTTNVSKYYPHLRRMLRSSNGLLDAVHPEEVKASVEKYGIAEELQALGYALSETERAAWVGFAGLAKKVESGEIPKQSNVILMFTGKGCKESFVQTQPDFIVDPKVDDPVDVLRYATAS
jgi:threonine synthase